MTAEIVLDAVTMTIRHDEPRDFGTPPSLAEMEAMAYQEFEHIPSVLITEGRQSPVIKNQ